MYAHIIIYLFCALHYVRNGVMKRTINYRVSICVILTKRYGGNVGLMRSIYGMRKYKIGLTGTDVHGVLVRVLLGN